MTQRDGLLLTLAKARSHTGLDLVSAEDVCEPVSGNTYAEMERASESPTHARLRELAIEAFVTYGYQVYPSGVGVRKIFVMADFLVVRDHRTIFVEVLTDAKATPNDLRIKQQLAEHGELAFVFIGNIKNRDPVALAVQAQAAQTHDVLLGNWGWGSCDYLAPAHPFQRFAFILNRDEPMTIGVRITISEQRIILLYSLTTAPCPVTRFGVLSPDPTTEALPAFARQVASALATKLLAKWSKPRRGSSILKDTISGKRLAKRLVPGSQRHHHEDPFDPLSIELEPAAAVDAIAATRHVADEYRLTLTWTGAAHEEVAEHATRFRSRPVKATAQADITTLLQAMRATNEVSITKLDLLQKLGWTAHRGNRVFRQLVADGVLGCCASRSGIIFGLKERLRSVAEMKAARRLSRPK